MTAWTRKLLPAATLLAMTFAFTLHLRNAEAWRGGYGGGSFRGGVFDEGYRGGEAYAGPRETEAVEGPRGGEAMEGPRGGEAIQGPGGNAAVRGPQGNVAIGDRAPVLPAGANRVVISGQTYFVYGRVYYMPFYYGGEITYVVVENPHD